MYEALATDLHRPKMVCILEITGTVKGIKYTLKHLRKWAETEKVFIIPNKINEKKY